MIHILTGWGNAHACATAVALQCHPDAVIEPVSKGKLPSLMKRIPKREKRPDEILMIGVDDHELEDELHKKTGITISVISVFLDERWPQRPGKKKKPADAPTLSLVRQTAAALDVPDDEIKHIFKVHESSKPNAKTQQILDLLEAGAWFYRVEGRHDFYVNAIRTLANDDRLTAKQEEGIEFYQRHSPYELRGNSEAMKEVKRRAGMYGCHPDLPVMIQGESGTGKEFVAYTVHFASPRRDHPFVALNCASIPANLLSSELFGHIKGAFTGAVADRKGAFRSAHKGTLFLDEIGDMPLELQASLLRVLETKRVVPLGSDKEVMVDTRIICATHRDLWAMVQDGDFREDLYYRLKGTRIHIPPLRERLDDIREIANARLYRAKNKKPLLTDAQLKQLKSYHWPGNVRQLLNILMKAEAHAMESSAKDGTDAKAESVNYLDCMTDEPDYELGTDSGSSIDAEKSVENFLPADDILRSYCLRVYSACKQNKKDAAEILEVDRTTLWRNLKRWGVE